MKKPDTSPVLADAADVLSDQLRVHLNKLARVLGPHADSLESRFLTRLRQQRFDPRQRSALAAITLGGAARILAGGQPLLRFFEQVEYSGRRLAKLNLPPTDIVRALQVYDGLLTPALRRLVPAEYANFQWVRDQLHFCVILTLNNAFYQVREAETEAFYELFRVELESRNLDELVHRFLETLAGFCHADAARLFLVENDAWVLKASAAWSNGQGHPIELRPGGPAARALSRPRLISRGSSSEQWQLDPSWRSRFRSCWSIPLTDGARLAGVMQFGFTKPYEWLPREQELLAAAAERCLMAAEKARLMEDLAAREEQVRQLAEHMLHVEEAERRRVSRELHDEAGQSLLCIRLQLEMLEASMPPDQPAWKEKLAEAREMTERTILEIRRLIGALSPAVLAQLGLGAALRQLVNRFRRMHPARVRLHLSRLANLPQNIEIIVYRLLQECFNNIAKHSQATAVNISVVLADGVLRLNVEDNGIGFNVEEALVKRDSFGLSGLRERVALLGGRFEIDSRPAAAAGRSKPGTRIAIELPVPGGGAR